MEYNFKKVHTGKDLAISSIVLAAGIGFFFVNKGLGICIAACGLVMFLVYKAGCKKDGQGVLLDHKALDLCAACKQSLTDFLKGKDVNPEVKEGHEGGSVRLEVWYNKAEGIAYAQLFTFSNYTYEPETGVVELHYPKADKLISKL